MNIKAMMTAAGLLIAASTAALAQSGQPGQSGQSGQSVRDILNRAQTQSDRKAVEDLIGKLRTSPQPPAVQPAPPAPAAVDASQAQPAPSAQPLPATQPTQAATVPTQPAAPAVTIAPAAPSAPEPIQASVPAAAPPVAAAPAVAPQQQSSEPIGGAAAGVAIGPAPSAPAAAIEQQQPERQAPVVATPARAPVGSARTTAGRRPAAAAAGDTGNIGTPIGPAEAVPTPIGPSEAEMARAPDIARERGLPTVDIEVLFSYDSSEISPAAAEGLMSLGRALQDPRLAGQKFVIIGHTDAKGAASYNLALSDRRAAAVRNFLVEQFKIAPDNLLARGFGESRLKNARNPEGPENRRVQVINWSPQFVDQKRR